MKFLCNYIVEIQYLGFRFHGWQKQQNVKTLHEMIDKTLHFVFKGNRYKSLGAGRTDAMVSANNYFFQLFLDEEIDKEWFIDFFNKNLPPDINALSIKRTPLGFDLINCPKTKEYHYYFSYGNKNHPFAAPFIVNIPEDLNIDLMQKGASLFQGEHYFHKYCTKPSLHTVFKRKINSCKIVKNTQFTASFFPDESFVLKIKGKGFLRYQIRLIMGTLFELGKENLDLEFIVNSLKEENDKKYLRHNAFSSGLQLYNIELDI
ncbi:MAG: tRNA pseudouridine(38-40) synthase TruA [Polaribacter sp.]|mgnify:CR=1 FL=1|nr:tRNA pseudouridine(38-40) synthase TruA [Polaribacter sp.]